MMKRKYKLLSVILASLCMLSLAMLPSYAATTYYEYEGRVSDSNGNYIDGYVSITEKDSSLYRAGSVGDLRTTGTLPTTHYVYLIAVIRANYEGEAGVWYYRKGTNEIGHLVTHKDYSVSSALSLYDGAVFSFDQTKTVAYIEGWTKLSFTNNSQRLTEVVPGLLYYVRKTPEQLD